ncbi:MAG TPA: response regulator transcription factor [Candidatus Baltobacteraceae bacterium]|nr:response regulator transcription factor [Candidatus Baltobacteraceae bacterium]
MQRGAVSGAETKSGKTLKGEFSPYQPSITARISQADVPAKSSEKIRVALVDDDPGIHAAMRQVFKNHAVDWTLECFLDGNQALHEFAQSPPRAVLMDISMPDITGIECAKRLKTSLPDLPVIMFTARDDSESLVSSMMAGASGYVVKPSSPSETITAIKKVLDGAPMFCARTEKTIVQWLRSLGDKVAAWQLTAREEQIMLQVCASQSDKDIAILLKISHHTVHNHMQSIFRKLGVRNRDEAKEKFLISISQ